MTDRLDQLTECARATADWIPANEELARRVEEMVARRGRAPHPGSVEPVGGEGGASSLGVRAASAAFASSLEIYRTFPGGEIACVAEEGEALGAWILRGTVWLHDSGRVSAEVDWIVDDHVIVSVGVRSGESFEVEEFVGGSWHIELRLSCGSAYRFDALAS